MKVTKKGCLCELDKIAEFACSAEDFAVGCEVYGYKAEAVDANSVKVWLPDGSFVGYEGWAKA